MGDLFIFCQKPEVNISFWQLWSGDPGHSNVHKCKPVAEHPKSDHVTTGERAAIDTLNLGYKYTSCVWGGIYVTSVAK